MSLVSEYRNQVDGNKIQFFKELSNEEKKELYDGLEKNEQEHLLFLLPFQYIKSFIFSLNKEEQKKIYAQLNNNQLKAIYNSLNEAEKEEMEFALEDRQVDFIRNMDQAMYNIHTARNEIENAQNQITNSSIQQVNDRIELQNQKQELKEIKVQFKQLEKERKRNLQKIKRASRSRTLDRIGFFSKRRMNKLMKITNELEEINQKFDSLRNQNIAVNENIKNAKEKIERERQNIIEAKAQILKSKYSIQENTRVIEETKVEIKKLSQVEKNVLGKKLYRKKINERNLLITRKKHLSLEDYKRVEKESIPVEIIPEKTSEITSVVGTNKARTPVAPLPSETISSVELASKESGSITRLKNLKEEYKKAVELGDIETMSVLVEEIDKIEPSQKEEPMKEPIKEKPVKLLIKEVESKEEKISSLPTKENSSIKTQNFLEMFSKLNEMGINFYPSTNIPMQAQEKILDEDPITTITRTQLTMLNYIMVTAIIIEQQRRAQLAQNQELSESHTRTLGKSGAFVSLTLLISILLFIFSLALFFIA